MDVPLYDELMFQFKDVPPVDVVVARRIAGLKPAERDEIVTDPEEIAALMATWGQGMG